MTTQELIDYYVNLLIIQYHNKPKAKATIADFCSEIIADQIYTTVQNAFDINIAVGKQLDYIGEYVGVRRNILTTTLARDYFIMPDVNGTNFNYGFADVTSPDPIFWYFLTVTEGQTVYSLTDAEMKNLILFKSIVNNLFLSFANIDNLCYNFFGNTIGMFEDLMIIYYIEKISTVNPFFQIVKETNNLPKPSGVRIDSFRSETFDVFFGFQDASLSILNPTFVGFSSPGSEQIGSFIQV